MKKCIWFLSTVIIFVACTKTNEDKAEELIRAEMNKLIVNIDTYEPIETEIDSAYAPMQTVEAFSIIKALPAQARRFEQLEREVSSAESMMSIYKDSYSEHSKYEYNKYKKEYDQAVKEKDELQQSLLDLGEKMTQWSKEDSVFNGFILSHHFRYVNKEGEKTIGKMLFLVDKKMTKVEATLDLEDEDMKTLIEYYETYNLYNKD